MPPAPFRRFLQHPLPQGPERALTLTTAPAAAVTQESHLIVRCNTRAQRQHTLPAQGIDKRHFPPNPQAFVPNGATSRPLQAATIMA